MNDLEEYLNVPEEGEMEEMEMFEYDYAATPYRTTQVYKISYDNNLSKNDNQPK